MRKKTVKKTIKKRIRRNKMTKRIKGTKRTKRRKSTKIKSYKMNISEETYQKLLSKKRLTKKEREKLDRALHLKYCNCVKGLKYVDKNPAAYGICANSVYKNRGFELPPNAARNCKK